MPDNMMQMNVAFKHDHKAHTLGASHQTTCGEWLPPQIPTNRKSIPDASTDQDGCQSDEAKGKLQVSGLAYGAYIDCHGSSSLIMWKDSMCLSSNKDMWQFRWLVIGFPMWWLGFHCTTSHVGYVVDKVTAKLLEFQFPLLISISLTAPNTSSSIIWGWYNRLNSGLHTTRKYQVFLRSVHRLLVAACVVPSSPIFVTLMKEAPGSSEMLVLTRATRR
jgi:hypothetical protein